MTGDAGAFENRQTLPLIIAQRRRIRINWDIACYKGKSGAISNFVIRPTIGGRMVDGVPVAAGNKSLADKCSNLINLPGIQKGAEGFHGRSPASRRDRVPDLLPGKAGAAGEIARRDAKILRGDRAGVAAVAVTKIATKIVDLTAGFGLGAERFIACQGFFFAGSGS